MVRYIESSDPVLEPFRSEKSSIVWLISGMIRPPVSMEISCVLNKLIWYSLNREMKIVLWHKMSFMAMKLVYTVFNVRESWK